ncbi:hypothetical protein KJZ63_02230 [Patescibacteria group bacterium]|nr:hypothetical protein [Patescibacteria group bacterium]
MKNLYLNFCKLATLVLMVGLSVRFLNQQNIQFLVQADDDENVTICHATNSYSNPYTNPTVDKDSIINLPNGHDTHNGPIFYLEIPKHTKWGDIIPQFNYGCEVVDVAEHWGEWEDGKCTGNATCEERVDERTVLSCAENGFKLNDEKTLCVRGKEVMDTIEVVEEVDQFRLLVEATYKDGICTYEGKNWDEQGQSIYENGCIAPDACQETVRCDDSCRTEDVIIQGSCDPIVCKSNAESCNEQEASPTPTPTPTPSPVPTEPPGYNCPVAQSCPSACGQAASDVPNGSCGFNHCDPTPSCDGGIGGGSQGQVLGTSTMSGQVLGASTYAATGVVEDALFSLMGVAGAGLSGAGILLKRNEKRQK